MKRLESKLRNIEKKLEAARTEVITIIRIILSTSKPHFGSRCRACDALVPDGKVWIITCEPKCCFWEMCE